MNTNLHINREEILGTAIKAVQGVTLVSALNFAKKHPVYAALGVALIGYAASSVFSSDKAKA